MVIKSTCKIHLEYFALMREQRGLASESIETDALTVEELYLQLQERYGFSLSISLLRVAINDSFCSWDTALQSGDRVVFIPPVAGG